MKKEELIAKITAANENIIIHPVVKNGTEFTGITIKDQNPGRILYVEDILETVNKGTQPVNEIISEVIEILTAPVAADSKIDLPSPEEIMNTVTFRLVKDCPQNEKNCASKFHGLCVMLQGKMVCEGNGGVFVISRELVDKKLNKAGYSNESIMKAALEHTEEEAVLKSLFGALYGNGGELNPDTCDAEDIYVLTNRTGFYGAASMMTNIPWRLACNLNKDICILPSSVHEVLLVPVEDGTDFNQLKEMVCTVNATEVEEHERLADTCYVLNRENGTIREI